jgi:hypothetical protein
MATPDVKNGLNRGGELFYYLNLGPQVSAQAPDARDRQRGEQGGDLLGDDQRLHVRLVKP